MAGQGRVEFVGRERELALLADRVRASADGAGQVVLLAGEPGIGKSRLAEEVADRAGLPCRWGRATDEEGNPPYWPFRQLVRALGPADPDPMRVVSDHGTEERFRVFEAVTDFLVAAAAPNGLVVVLDDLQWFDAASLQLLVHLSRRLEGSRLVVVATYLDTETGGREPLRRALAELAREPSATRLRLVGLPPFTAVARHRLARTLARRRRPGDREEAEALGALAAQLGMKPLRGQCQELAESLSGRVAGPLTKREQEIAVLVSQGLTSRQIAAAAHITERTVENHVQHILGKLGFANRAQIAAWVVSGQEMRTRPEY